MDTDEKNKYSSIINEFDPDFRREKDKYDVAKEDKEFQRSHHHPIGNLHSHPSKIVEHDPFNVKHPTTTGTSTHESSHRHEVHPEPMKIMNLEDESNRKIIHPEYRTEKIYDKMNEFPEMPNSNIHR
jgi:hypothetical protein